VKRLQLREEGFGLVEMMIALMVLSIGLLGLLSLFASGSSSIRRASRTSTASSLADSQLELYRALTYSAIALDQSALATVDSTYRSDPALPGGSTASEISTATGCTGLPNQCNPSRTLTGPDSGSYRIDTYIVSDTPANGRTLKLVTVVVRDASNLTGPSLARDSSSFDQATG